MASGTIYGKWHSVGTGSYRIILRWSSSMDIPNNRSKVTVKTYLDADWSLSYSATKYGNTNLNGESRNWSDSTDHSGTGEWLLNTQEFWIAHDADGSKKNVQLSGWFDLNITLLDGRWVGRLSASGTINLDTIPRASTISSFPNFTIGESFTVAINRASSSFTHKLVLKAGTYTVATRENVGTSINFKLSAQEEDGLYHYLRNETKWTVTMYCYTYSGGKQIGSHTTKTATAYVGSHIVPTFETIAHSEYVQSIKEKIGAYVQGKSRLSLEIKGASGAKHSTIESYKIEFDGSTYNSRAATSGYINGSGSLTIKGTVTDSRGRTASKTVTVNVLPYEQPKITNFTLGRCNEDGTPNNFGQYAKVHVVGTWSDLKQKNPLTIEIRSRLKGEEFWETKDSLHDGQNGFAAERIVGTYETSKSYEFEVIAEDLFHAADSLQILPTAAVAFDLGRTGIGAGKYHERGSIDAVGDCYFQDGIILTAPNGDEYRLTVNDNGSLIVTKE